MAAKATVRYQLAALLPTRDAQHVMDLWSIGEQEAGIDLLISALL